MPITTFLILFWMYYENVSENKISAHISYTLLYLIATVPMFLIFPYCLNKFGFWITIFISIFITIISALIVHQISKNFDIKLFLLSMILLLFPRKLIRITYRIQKWLKRNDYSYQRFFKTINI